MDIESQKEDYKGRLTSNPACCTAEATAGLMERDEIVPGDIVGVADDGCCAREDPFASPVKYELRNEAAT